MIFSVKNPSPQKRLQRYVYFPLKQRPFEKIMRGIYYRYSLIKFHIALLNFIQTLDISVAYEYSNKKSSKKRFA